MKCKVVYDMIYEMSCDVTHDRIYDMRDLCDMLCDIICYDI